MKKLLPIIAISLFTLAACQTTSTETPKEVGKTEMVKPENNSLECTPENADNPQCGTGGPASSGPITVTDDGDGCTPGDPDNPQCGTGGPASSGPITG